MQRLVYLGVLLEQCKRTWKLLSIIMALYRVFRFGFLGLRVLGSFRVEGFEHY